MYLGWGSTKLMSLATLLHYPSGFKDSAHMHASHIQFEESNKSRKRLLGRTYWSGLSSANTFLIYLLLNTLKVIPQSYIGGSKWKKMGKILSESVYKTKLFWRSFAEYGNFGFQKGAGNMVKIWSQYQYFSQYMI